VTWTADDGVMAGLRSWLVDQGFVVLTDHYDSNHFGNQVVELARPIAVRLVRDRSEWEVFIAGSDGAWLPLDEWVKAITGTRVDVATASARADALRALLPEIERRAAGSDVRGPTVPPG
jgi:hypothetical protein